jgi:hypothetical protein
MFPDGWHGWLRPTPADDWWPDEMAWRDGGAGNEPERWPAYQVTAEWLLDKAVEVRRQVLIAGGRLTGGWWVMHRSTWEAMLAAGIVEQWPGLTLFGHPVDLDPQASPGEISFRFTARQEPA